MRIQQVGLLVGFYFKFIRRRVLRKGILAAPAARIAAVILAATALVLLTGTAFFILKDLIADPAILSLMMHLSSLSSVLWVLVAFIFTKVLFLKSERMLSLTYHLPITGKERAVALVLFEALMVAVTISVLFTSSMVPLVLLHGIRALILIFWAIVCPVTVSYLLLNALYLGAQRLLGLVGFERARSVILLGAVSIAAGLYYGRSVKDTIAVANAYARGETLWTTSTVFLHLTDKAGWLASLGVFLAVSALLLWLSITLTPHIYMPSQRHIPIPLPFVMHFPGLGPQLAMHVRSSDWMLAAILTLVLGSVCLLSDVAPPSLACGLLAFQGIGAYADTCRLRWIHPIRHPSALRAYIQLLGSQIVALMPLLTFLTAAGMIKGGEPANHLTASLGILGGVFLTTLIGILFPPDHDNPFSTAIGVAILASIGTLGILAVQVFSLSPPILIAAGVAAVLLSASLSVAGIHINQRRSRHEETN